MFKKILVATDISDIGKQIFAEAVEMAKAIGADVMLLHVLSPFDEGYPNLPLFPGIESYHPMVYDPVLSERISEEYSNQLNAYAENSLRILKDEVAWASAQGVNADYTQGAGEPGHAICKLASTWGADLIMIGRRGRQGLSELVLGSVSNYVLHHAPCSVLTVQGRDLKAGDEPPTEQPEPMEATVS